MFVKCFELSSVCRFFLRFLKVNIVLGERLGYVIRFSRIWKVLVFIIKLWKILGKMDFYFFFWWFISIFIVYLGWEEKYRSFYIS